ncbi:hypothetical protein GGR57DRAFT_476007 [Xylariaceae sp. FL1272]|nr:hypothetical protein GGR57DRAFT_476007 [Xylariaceae sp. FL1272]
MRDGATASSSSRGLAMPLRMMQKRLKYFEVSERKQVGDAESMMQESARFTHDKYGGEL